VACKQKLSTVAPGRHGRLDCGYVRNRDPRPEHDDAADMRGCTNSDAARRLHSEGGVCGLD
jgi:hypothetical protein